MMQAQKEMVRAMDMAHDIDGAKVAAIAAAIEDGAIMAQPVVVEDTGNGAFVIDGHHRLKAGLEFGPVECWVVSMDDFSDLIDSEFEGSIPDRLSEIDQFIEIDGAPYSGRD